MMKVKLQNSVKAWIVENDCILAVVKSSNRLRLPGGKQKNAETLEETLRRECEEELGAAVKVERLLAVYEFPPSPRKQRRKVEFLFQCRLLSEPSEGQKPDHDQIGFHWLPLHQLKETDFVPSNLVELMQREQENVYIGEI